MIGLTRPRRLVTRIAPKTTATCTRYGRKKATIRRIVRRRRSGGMGGGGSPPPNGPRASRRRPARVRSRGGLRRRGP